MWGFSLIFWQTPILRAPANTDLIKVLTHVGGHVFCSPGLLFIWLKLSSSICWGYFLWNLVICCFVIVAHSNVIAKKWRSVRLANVLNITKCSRWHLPPSLRTPHPNSPPFIPHSLHSHLSGVETYQTKWHLRDWLGSLCHLCLEMVECPARLTKSCWRLLPPIGDSGISKNEAGWFFWGCHQPCCIPQIASSSTTFGCFCLDFSQDIHLQSTEYNW